VVAPSLLPHKASDRVNTDRRDAVQRARLARSGALTAVSVPQAAEEARRGLTRARAEPLSDLKDATLRRKAFLLRPDSRTTGQAPGGSAQRRGRAEVVCPPPAQPIVCQAYGRAVTAHTARLQRLDQARHEPVPAWRVRAVGEALQALRGVPCPVASASGERRP
jgi:transposase